MTNEEIKKVCKKIIDGKLFLDKIKDYEFVYDTYCFAIYYMFGTENTLKIIDKLYRQVRKSGTYLERFFIHDLKIHILDINESCIESNCYIEGDVVRGDIKLEDIIG